MSRPVLWPLITGLSQHYFHLAPPYHRANGPATHLSTEIKLPPYTSSNEIRRLVFPVFSPDRFASAHPVALPFYRTLVKLGCAPHVMREQWGRHEPYVLPSLVFGLTLLGLALLKGSSPSQDLFCDRAALFSTASLLLCFWVLSPKESLQQAQALAEDISRLDACKDPAHVDSTLRNLKDIGHHGLREVEIVLEASSRFLIRTEVRGPDYVRLRLEVLKASFYILSNIPWGATGDLSDAFYRYVERLDQKGCLYPREICALTREVTECGDTSNPALRLLTARIYALLKKKWGPDPVVREPVSPHVEGAHQLPGSIKDLNNAILNVLTELFTFNQVRMIKIGMQIALNFLNVVPLLQKDDSIREQILALVVNMIARKSVEIPQEDLEEIMELIGNYFRHARNAIVREDLAYMILLMRPYILDPHPAKRLAFAKLYYKMHHDDSDIQIGQFEDG